MAVGRSASLLLALVLCLTGCAVVQGESTIRLALLAPYEGRYREAGYNALYAARLALREAGRTDVELLPIDDGGSVESAVHRARALAGDPQIVAVITLGYPATSAEAQQAFGDLPILIAGYWSARPVTDSVFVLASAEMDTHITTPPHVEITDAARLDTPIIGGEILGLEQFPKLRDSLDEITVLSSAALPDAAFRERYLASGQFVPGPGLLATLTYDAVGLLITAAQDSDRSRVKQQISAIEYTGFNGLIRFENGYWVDAPLHTYGYNADRSLIPIDRIVK